MDILPTQPGPRRLAQAALVLAGLLGVYALLGFLAVAMTVQRLLPGELSRFLDRNVTLEGASLNPFALSLELRGLRVPGEQPNATLVFVRLLRVNAELFPAIRKRAALSEVFLDGLYAEAVLREDGTLDLADLLPPDRPPEDPPVPQPASAAWKYQLENVRVRNATLACTDRAAGVRHVLSNLTLNAPLVTEAPGAGETGLRLALACQAGEGRLALNATGNPLAANGTFSASVRVEGLALEPLLASVPLRFAGERPSGRVFLNATANATRGGSGLAGLSLAADLALEDLEVRDGRGQAALALARLGVEQARFRLPDNRLSVGRVSLSHPVVRAEWSPGGLDLAALVRPAEDRPQAHPAARATAREEAPDGPAFLAEVAEVRVVGGRVSLADLTVTPAFRTEVAPLDLTLSGLRSDGAGRVRLALDLRTATGEKLSLDAQGTTAPLDLAGTLEAAGLDLKGYGAYAAPGLPLDILDGRAGAKARFAFSLGASGPSLTLDKGEAVLENLRLRAPGDEVDTARIGFLALRGLDLDLAARRLDLGRVEGRDAAFSLRREKDGGLSLLKPRAAMALSEGNATGAGLSGPQSAAHGLAGRKAPTDAFGKRKGAATPARASGQGTAGEVRPWAVALNEAALENQAVRFLDRSGSRPVDLAVEGLNLRLTGLRLGPGADRPCGLDLSFRMGKGTARLSGELAPDLLRAGLDLDLSGLDISPLAGYAPEHVKLSLARGELSMKGRAELSLDPARGLSASWKGGLGVRRLLLTDTRLKAPLLEWADLDFKGVHAGFNPDYLQVERVGLSGLYAVLSLSGNRTLNVMDALAPPRSPVSGLAAGDAKAPSPAADPGRVAPAAQAGGGAVAAPVAELPNVVVESVQLTDSTVDFADYSFNPPVEMRIEGLHGQVQGLVTRGGTPADVSLAGTINGEGAMALLGQGVFFGRELILDLKMTTDGLDLSRMSAYSEKYLGQAVRSGKLSLDLEYKVRNNTLDSSNKITLDNLSMGRKVESPDAVDLPISLALAILRNSDGAVELVVPVKGDLTRPDFSLARVVWNAISGMFTKLILAPFSFLGLPFGMDKTGYIDFEPGSLELTPESARNLDKLVSAVADRPGVGIEVAGQVDPQGDLEGIRRYMLGRRLADLKIKDLLARGEAVRRVDDVVLGPGEYEAYLGRYYRAVKGFFRPFDPAETERQVLETIQPDEEGMRQFARRRALAVRDRLTGQGRIPVKRVFLVEPDKVAAQARDGARASRVNVTLRS